jgi:hypothetical protein
LYDPEMRVENAMHPSQKVFPLRVIRMWFDQKPGADAVVEGHSIPPFQYTPFARA